MAFSTTHSLFFQDCRDCSNRGSASVQIVVTSPPYPMIKMWDDRYSSLSPAIKRAFDRQDGLRAFDLIHAELDRVWAEMYRMLDCGCFLCVNIGDATRTMGGTFRLFSNHARITEACRRLGFDALPLIHWWKPTNAPNKFMGSGMLPAGAYVTLEHEYVLIFRKGGKREFKSREQKKRRGESAYFWEERSVWFSDTWNLTGLRQGMNAGSGRDRSAAFPFELPYRLINMYSVKGDTVLDPFLGTGTTALAAIASARSSIGMEIDRSFGKIVGERIRSCKDPLNDAVRERIDAHLRFVEERRGRGKEVKHRNAAHGFPVMTRQETGLRIHSVERIEETPEGSFMVTYGGKKKRIAAHPDRDLRLKHTAEYDDLPLFKGAAET
jgi:DNA modification methylase